MPTVLPANLSKDQEEAYLCKFIPYATKYRMAISPYIS